MFDLKFFGIVYDILEWTEGPPFRFLNEHESFHTRFEQTWRESVRQRVLETDPNEKAIRHYVANTYFVYFGLQISVDKTNLYNRMHFNKAY